MHGALQDVFIADSRHSPAMNVTVWGTLVEGAELIGIELVSEPALVSIGVVTPFEDAVVVGLGPEDSVVPVLLPLGVVT